MVRYVKWRREPPLPHVFFRTRSRRCLRTWCRSNTPTSSSSTSTGWTWRRVRRGYDLLFFKSLSVISFLLLSHACEMNRFPRASHRLYSSQNTCRRAASSSSWRKLRRTTRPWMWRSVLVIYCMYNRCAANFVCCPVVVAHGTTDPYFPQDYRLCNRTAWWLSLLRHISPLPSLSCLFSLPTSAAFCSITQKLELELMIIVRYWSTRRLFWSSRNCGKMLIAISATSSFIQPTIQNAETFHLLP